MLAPCSAASRLRRAALRAGLDRACARRSKGLAGRDGGTAPARTKELDDEILTTKEPAEVCERNGEMEVGLPGALRTLVTLMALFEACPLIRSHAR
jgi:hypothetical protein